MFTASSASRNQDLFQKLPQPTSITANQIKSCYRSLFDKMLKSFNNKDFIRLKNLLSSTHNTSIITYFSYPLSEEDSTKDNLLADLAYLII